MIFAAPSTRAFRVRSPSVFGFLTATSVRVNSLTRICHVHSDAELFFFRLQQAGRDLPLVHVQSHEACCRFSVMVQTPEARSAGGSHTGPLAAKRDLRDRISLRPAGGQIGNYLFELWAQPGGPRGAHLRRRARSRGRCQRDVRENRRDTFLSCGARRGGECLGGRAEGPEAAGRQPTIFRRASHCLAAPSPVTRRRSGTGGSPQRGRAPRQSPPRRRPAGPRSTYSSFGHTWYDALGNVGLAE
jgi:hypothetical protein